jgi:dynein heavy chain
MDKEKSKFENRMAQEQEEFKTEIEEIDRTIMNFYQYTEIKQHHAVADMCQNVNEKLKEFAEKARKFNN